MLEIIRARIAELETEGRHVAQHYNTLAQQAQEVQQGMAQAQARLHALNGALSELRALEQQSQSPQPEPAATPETPSA